MVIFSFLYIIGVFVGGDGWVCWFLYKDGVGLFLFIVLINIVLKNKIFMFYWVMVYMLFLYKLGMYNYFWFLWKLLLLVILESIYFVYISY